MVQTDDQTWLKCHHEDLWIYDKLILSKKLEYTCGPIGLNVPKPDYYCIRPIMNTLGMSRNSKILWIESSTDQFHPAEFWCEVFSGRHLSIDYEDQIPILSVEGIKSISSPLYKWTTWKKVDEYFEFPMILKSLKGIYSKINCEFIGNHLIEVHLRHNPDFQYGNTEAIPVWNDEEIIIPKGYEYISSPDYLRKGFYIK